MDGNYRGYDWHNSRAIKYENARNYDGALAEYTALFLHEPDDELSCHGIGRAYLGKEDYDRAIQYFEKALQISKTKGHKSQADSNYDWIARAKRKQAEAEAAKVDKADKEKKAREAKEIIDKYSNAAAQGDAEAQYNMGLLYFNGPVVPHEYTKAVEWFSKAAEQGHEEAKDYLVKAEAERIAKAEADRKAAEEAEKERKEAPKRKLRNKIIRCIIGGILGAFFGLISGGRASEILLIIDAIIGVVLGVITGIFTGESITGVSGFLKGAIIGAIGFAIISGISGMPIFLGIFCGAIGCGITGALTGAFFSNYD